MSACDTVLLLGAILDCSRVSFEYDHNKSGMTG